MIVIPAIDLSKGCCVRLAQGDMQRKTVYSDDPAEMARRWADGGAEIIHVVDLDGAVSGERANAGALKAICEATKVPVEVGGGIRTIEDVRQVLGLGARWAILGTAALRDPAMLQAAVKEFSEAIVAGIDARDGRVAVQGWTEDTSVLATDLARQTEALGVQRIIATDIATDGVLTGPNLRAMRTMAEALHIEVTASGGISSLEDIRALATLEPLGVTSCIVGRALYEGKFTLREAIAAGALSRAAR
ncbi:MAG: 1-(5-phosphoribosyl)-5-[(5-phosphoribosylamino)methylideneamino]imidazole-4-carboxamide isomerase [Armatimonadetes bacterium]|nr:1-(5-phosphoribosyl)-5-[(5-phosphoribosylamino)methylideneamino]imidazole-4-carboxamide isomerase [Armatimonadota bacterium]